MRPSTNFFNLLFAGALSEFGSLPLFLSQGIPGYDSSSHVAKTAFLMYSFSHGNFSGWSEFWYSGFQLFYTYSPLTYVLAAFLGWPFASAMLGMKILIVLSFFLSGIGSFALARDFNIPNNWSLVAAVLYSLISPHILTLFYTGTLTYSLAFALAPFLFLSLRIAIRKETIRSVIYLGFMIGLMIISNETTSYVIFFPLVAYLVISTQLSKAVKTCLVLFGSSIIGLLLSAFWLIPYLKIDLSGEFNLLSESSTGAYPAVFVIHWYNLFLPDFGNTNAGDLGWILVLPALASIIFLKKRDEIALYGAGILIIFLTLGASLSPLFYKIPLVLALQFSWRFVIGDVLFLTPLAVLFFYRFGHHLLTQSSAKSARTRINAIFLIVVIVFVPVAFLSLSSSLYGNLQARQVPSDPNQAEAYNFLSNQTGFYRVMVVDRYYEAFPQYTWKGSIDGWYDQATTHAYRSYTFNIYYCLPGNRTLGGLQLLGVRYVMIDYAYGGDAAGALRNYESQESIFGPPVYDNSEVIIFQVPDSKLIYVSSSFPNNAFSFSQNVNCNEAIPSAPSSGNVSYSISNLDWQESKISFDVVSNRSAYVLISNAYSYGWLATDNGSSIPIALSPPDLPVVHISNGTHHIVLYYSGAPSSQSTAILSLATVLAIVGSIPFWMKYDNKALQKRKLREVHLI